MVTGVPGRRARSALAGGPGGRFADVRWVAETGSTNADALALLRDGAARGDRRRGRPPDRRPGPPRAHLGGAPWGLAAAVDPAPPTCGGGRGLHHGGGGGRRGGARGGGRLLPAPQVAERPRVARRRLGAGPQAGRDPGRGRLAGRHPGRGRLPPADVGRAHRRGGRHRHQRGLAGPSSPRSWPRSRSPATTSPARAVDRVDLLVALLRRLAGWYEPLVASRRRRPARWRPGGRDRPPSGAGSGSTSAATTSRALPSTSPRRATSWWRPRRATAGRSWSVTSSTSATPEAAPAAQPRLSSLRAAIQAVTTSAMDCGL